MSTNPKVPDPGGKFPSAFPYWAGCNICGRVFRGRNMAAAAKAGNTHLLRSHAPVGVRA